MACAAAAAAPRQAGARLTAQRFKSCTPRRLGAVAATVWPAGTVTRSAVLLATAVEASVVIGLGAAGWSGRRGRRFRDAHIAGAAAGAQPEGVEQGTGTLPAPPRSTVRSKDVHGAPERASIPRGIEVGFVGEQLLGGSAGRFMASRKETNAGEMQASSRDASESMP